MKQAKKIVIEITTENAAFGESNDDVEIEVRRILDNTSYLIVDRTLLDGNGNKVGSVKIEY